MLRSFFPKLKPNLNAAKVITAAARGCSATSTKAPKGVPYEGTLKDKKEDSGNAPTQADVVVIGGGSAGCNALYHLAKLGITNAVLIEKDQLTAGTTWHTAGLLWRLRPNDVDCELIEHTRNTLKQLETETGVNPGWIENGGLFIANNRERMDEYKRLYTLGKYYGIESHVLSPEDTKKLYPLMNVDDIYGTLYVPGDGTLDPAGFCQALTRSATNAGAKVMLNCSVTGIQVDKDSFGTKRVVGVETTKGIIKTDRILNCAGVWGPAIGQMAGVNIPLCVMRHAYVVTEKIEGIQNMPNVRDHDASVYLRLQGDALSVGGYESDPIFWKDVQPDFAFSLFELDWDVFSCHIGGAVNRVPVIENTGVKSTVCGPESFTPDHRPLIGESPEVRGFFFSCGYNSGGMMYGSGCGREAAKWVVNGRPDLDMFAFDIRRFAQKMTHDKSWIDARSHEAYAKNYSTVFPHDEPLASRNMRKDPFYDALAQAGCHFQERHGWERPGWFNDAGQCIPLEYDWYGNYGHALHEDNKYYELLKNDYTFEFPKHHDLIRDEALNCRENVAAFDMSYFGKYYLIGPDAQKAADWLFSNDVSKSAGNIIYTCMLNKNGGTESDLTVSIEEPGNGGSHAPKFEGRGFYLAVGGAAAQQNWNHITNVIQDQNFNCQLLNHTEDLGLLSIQGPKSRDLLQSLTETDLSNEAFPFSTHKLMSIGGYECRALRMSFVGELGWELHIPKESCLPVYNTIMKEGAKHGIRNAGYRAIDSLSIEKGYRHWHADLRSDDTPLEAAIGYTCKLRKDTPFLGRESIEKQKASGLKKKIVCFTLDDHVALHGLEAIWRDDQVVGYIRRADYAFALGKSIGYGYVRHPKGENIRNDWLKAGSYKLERMGQSYKATLHTQTPFDPKNKRVKGIYDEILPIRA